MRRPRLLFAVLFFPVAVWADPPRQVEVFGSAGVMALGDEDQSGTGPAFGGSATMPFARRWALDLQALTAKVQDRPDYRLRFSLLSPALQYRRGDHHAYWFLGFGPGLHVATSSGFYGSPDSTGMSLHWRTGGVFAPTPRVLIRGEFFWVNRYAIPHVGALISVGMRLGRQ